jgi:hypothetical protein
MRRTLSHLPTILLLLIGALLLASFAVRILWGTELRHFEERFFDSLGVPSVVRYALIAGLLGFSWYRIYVLEKAEAAAQRQPVVRGSVVFVSLGVLAIAMLILFVGSH